MAAIRKYILYLLIGFIVTCSQILQSNAELTTKDNGDVYIANDGYRSSEKNISGDLNSIDLNEVMSVCNGSFSIPMDYIVQFNSTGELPNIVDKTGPCYIRCFYEKSGFIDNWKLNAAKIQQYMWPATGDTIEVCQEEGKNETNACLRTYAIAKCLMIRALVDARSVIH